MTILSKTKLFFNKLNERFSNPRLSQDAFDPGSVSLENLQTLLMISQTLTSQRNLDEVLGFLLGEIQKSLHIDCGVLMVEDDGYFRVRAHREFSASFAEKFKVPLGQGPVGQCYSLNQKLVLSRKDLSTLPEFEVFLRGENWQSLFITALTVQNQNLCVFLATSKKMDFFSEKMLNMMEPFLKILSVGIRNAQFVERMEKFSHRLEAEISSTTKELTLTNNRLIHRVRELKALYEIALTAGNHASLEEVFKIVSAKVQELFNLEHVGFFINLSPKEKFAGLSLQYPSFGLPKEVHEGWRIDSNNFAQGGPMTKTIFESFSSGTTKIFQVIPTSLKSEVPSCARVSDPKLLEKVVFHSLTVVPLESSQTNLGVMVLLDPMKNVSSSQTPEEFSKEQQRTLTLIANRIVAAIENIHLNLEIQKRLADLSALQEVNETLYANPIFEFDLAKIVKIILKSLSCDLCAFMFFDPSSAELVTRVSQSSLHTSGESAPSMPTPSERNASIQVFKEGKSQILNDVCPDNNALLHTKTGQKNCSLMLVPLKVEKEVIGVLKLGSREKSFFNRHHLRLAELIAARAAVVVQNAQLYEKIMRSNKELERLNRVKMEFVSMVSHELRTPLTALKGFVDIVMTEEAGSLNDQQKHFLEIAHGSIDRLSILISDLLDISRIESGQMKLEFVPLSLERVLRESFETYQAATETKKIAFSLEVKKKLPEIMADELRIKQVMDNLISNAMKFTPTGGNVKIVADDMGDFVLVSVADTGIGIKKEDQGKVFEKFYQVDSSLTRQVGGTGLGLAISKSIIEVHGGRIWVESEVGKGSTFRFLLPRMRKEMYKSNGKSSEKLPTGKRTDLKSKQGR